MPSKPKQRGARKAPRSSFRAKAKPKPKPKPKQPKPKPKPKARPARKPRAARVVRAAAADARVLGEISVPSGRLAIFDVGLCGYLPREALEPAIIKCDVPRDRALCVVGMPIGKGRFADCWDHVAIGIASGDIVHSKKLGEAGVDFARLVCMDHAALDAWQHEDSLDGRADIVFWGRDDRILARAMNAPRIADGYGWVDLPLAEAERKADEIATRKAENKWLLAADFRPHSHHYYALAAARRSPDGAGILELAGTRLLLFFTSWGDGVYPVYLDVDHDDRPVQVRIQLATAASSAAAAVHP